MFLNQVKICPNLCCRDAGGLDGRDTRVKSLEGLYQSNNSAGKGREYFEKDVKYREQNLLNYQLEGEEQKAWKYPCIHLFQKYLLAASTRTVLGSGI